LERTLEGATPLLDFYMEQTLSRFPDNLAGKSKAAQEVTGLIARVQGATRQALIRQAISERLGVSEEALLLSERRHLPDQDDRQGIVQPVPTDFEFDLLRLILQHPECCPDVFEADLGLRMTDSTARKLYTSLFRQYARSGWINPDHLVEDLSPDEVDLLTGLAMDDDGLHGPEIQNAVHDFITRFALRDRRRKATDLSKRIKQAQESGDDVSLGLLLREKNRLLKEKNIHRS